MLQAVALNQCVLSGSLAERKPLRYTPVGLAVSEARLVHASEQLEAEKLRQIRCEFSVLAIGEMARWLDAAPLGTAVRISGFMAAKSQRSSALVLHVQQIEFLEGIENGSFL